MKQVVLSLSDIEMVEFINGQAAAVEHIRQQIETQVGRPIELTLRGPNREFNKVAGLGFVSGALWNQADNTFEVNRLTNGFGQTDDLAVSDLFSVLTSPSKFAPRPAVAKTDDKDDAAKEVHVVPPVAGLIVGSFAKPDAFVTFKP